VKPLASNYVYRSAWRRFAAGIFDRIGGLFFGHYAVPVPLDFSRILLIRADQIGDVILSLPAVDALRKSFPNAEIDFCVAPWAEALLAQNAAISRIYLFKNSYFGGGFSPLASIREWAGLLRIFRRRRYDLIIDFRGDARNIILAFLAGGRRRVGFGVTGGGFLLTDCLPEIEDEHQMERNLRCVQILGCKAEGSIPRIYVPETEKKSFEIGNREFFSKLARPWTVIQMGSGYPSKRWPVSNFRMLIERWLEKTAGTVFLVGQKGEEELAAGISSGGNVVNWVGKTSFGELCVLLDLADVFVGNDSGPAHIAAGLGKKTVVLFSGTNEFRIWRPRGDRVSVLRCEVSCAPCHLKDCPKPRHECMEGISVEQVLQTVLSPL